ncbi:FAD-dependent oxidoreductase [Bradyrhizobium sp. CCBAU 53421]|uniref:FAD-dependent oxidoreductase n=1 Tax=Bradyrhizobium sp. CCBAU 53421 TaxID=1325120 RepID=UPI00188C234C|nr:FAD-dependent oxidoreductase [Bradyrhizobium sp. CCBAU 53421]
MKIGVVGAGIIGTSIAYHLGKAGAQVTIFDIGGPGDGVSSKSFACLNAFGQPAADLPFRLEAIRYHSTIARELGSERYLHITGTLRLGTVEGEAAKITANAKMMREFGGDANSLTGSTINELEPLVQAHRPIEGVSVPEEGWVDAKGLSRRLVHVATRNFDVRFRRLRVLRIGNDGLKPWVNYDLGTDLFDCVVLAAGSDTNPILQASNLTPFPIKADPGALREVPCHNESRGLGHVVYADSFHVRPSDRGGLLAGISPLVDDLQSSDRFEKESKAILDTGAEWIDRFAEMPGTPVLGIRSVTADELPILGRLEDANHIYIAVMHGGITLGPLVGRLVANEVVNEQASDLLARYRPSRFGNNATCAPATVSSSEDRRVAPMGPNASVEVQRDISLLKGEISLIRSTPPAPVWLGDTIRQSLAHVAEQANIGEIFRAHRFRGTEPDREAGAGWIAGRLGTAPAIDRMITTNGTQNALFLATLATTREKKVIAVEEIGYYAFRNIAALLGVTPRAVAMDHDGMLPDAFDKACNDGNVAAVYLQPTVHNPTAYVMSVERRQELAAVARRNNVQILEDDVYGLLPENSPIAISALAPELAWYATGPAKCVAPGLRIGYLVAPTAQAAAAAFAPVSTVTTWHVSPLVAEIAQQWIRDGTMGAIRDAIRAEVRTRQAIAAATLKGADYLSHSESIFIWLRLPSDTTEEKFVASARSRGVILRPGSMFWVSPPKQIDRIRVVLGSPDSAREVRSALEVIGSILH